MATQSGTWNGAPVTISAAPAGSVALFTNNGGNAVTVGTGAGQAILQGGQSAVLRVPAGQTNLSLAPLINGDRPSVDWLVGALS